MHQGDATTEPPSGISRRNLVRATAWSVPVVAAAIAIPQASASVVSPFTFAWGGVTPFPQLLHADETPVEESRLGRTRAYSTLSVNAAEVNAEDITVGFLTGASASGHTNYLGAYASGVGVWQLGSAPRLEWLEGTRDYNSLPVTSRFLIPAKSLRVGPNMFSLMWKLTPTTISYPGPYGRTGYDFLTNVQYQGQTIFTSRANGSAIDSTEPVQLEANDIYG